MLTRAAILLGVFLLAANAQADSFDHYTNEILVKVPKAKTAAKVKQVTVTDMVKNSSVLPGVSGTVVVVRTGEGRMSKLLVHPAEQKVGDKAFPILLIERFTTYREGAEKTVQVEGKNLRVFKDFRVNLDIGQVVPGNVPADLRFVADGENVYVEPVGKAELYLLTKHLPEATPKKLPRPEVGATFESRFFNGKYKLYDDGRRSGTLILKVADNGEVEGSYYSDKDGQKYEVNGKVGTNPNYAIQFKVMYPRARQSFHGFLFSGDGRAMTGSSRLEEREAGFYAVRLDE
jgi:hypothetical protein